MKNGIINELKFASKKKKNAVLGYVYCDYLLDMFEEIERLNNIINELEKYNNERLLEWENCQDREVINSSHYIKLIKDIKYILKGADKE